MKTTKKLHLTINCQAVYEGSMDVPIEMTFEDAITFARKNIESVPLGPLTYISGSDELDVDNCDFEDDVN